MRVHTKKPIRERLDEAIADAQKGGLTIDFIELSAGEWDELAEAVRPILLKHYSEMNMPCLYKGIEVRREVEPALTPEQIEAFKIHRTYFPPRICDELLKRFGKEPAEELAYHTWFTIKSSKTINSGICPSTTVKGYNVQGGIEMWFLGSEPKVQPGDQLEVRVKRGNG